MFPFSDFFWFDDSAYRFNRPMLERQGWYSKEKDGKLLLLLNVLGVNESDLNIEVKPVENNKEVICISGKTKDELFDREFSVNMNFMISKPMEQVKTSVKNGLLILEIEFKEPVKSSVRILKG